MTIRFSIMIGQKKVRQSYMGRNERKKIINQNVKNKVMGYSHYWYIKKSKRSRDEVKTDFKNAVARFKTLYEHMKEREEPIELFSYNGYDEPEITDELISFNGDAAKDLEYESFEICADDFFIEKYFRFCKTEEKPYDFAVCVCLLLFKEAFPNEFRYISDGGEEKWKPIKEWYESQK